MDVSSASASNMIKRLDGLLVVAVDGAEQVIGRPVAQKVVVEA